VNSLTAVSGISGTGGAPIERRWSRRMRVLKRGKTILQHNLVVFDCLIRDLSEGGARIVMDRAAILPAEFRLAILGAGEAREVRVVWRRADEAGVAFVPGPENIEG
jgi:PilZ domain